MIGIEAILGALDEAEDSVRGGGDLRGLVQLVRLLTDWKLADVPVHAYFPRGPATRAAARALVDHLAAEFDDNAIDVRHT